MRIKSRSATALIAAALSLAGCSTTLPTASEGTPSTPTAQAGTTAVLTYPDTPTIQWTTSLTETDTRLVSDAAFASPEVPWELFGLPVDVSPVDVGDVWIAAAPPALVGLDPDTGDRLWTYRPDDGYITRCAGDLMDGDLACTVSDDPTEATRTAVVLLDVKTGAETSRFDLPFPSRAFEVTGSEILTVMYTAEMPFPDDALQTLPENPYRLSRYTADGTEVWATDIPYVADGFVCGECTEASVGVNTSLADVFIMGQHFLFNLDGGAQVIHTTNWTPRCTLTRDRAVLSTTWETGVPQEVTVLAADGSGVTTLPDHVQVSTPLAGDEPILLMDGSGTISELDPITGVTTSTGVTWRTEAGPPSATLMGDYLFLGDLAYDLRQPETPAWQSPQLDPRNPSGDGALLYALHTEGDANTTRTSLTAVQVSDGATLWTLPLGEHDAGSGDPRLGTAGGRLIIVDGPTMTALQP